MEHEIVALAVHGTATRLSNRAYPVTRSGLVEALAYGSTPGVASYPLGGLGHVVALASFHDGNEDHLLLATYEHELIHLQLDANGTPRETHLGEMRDIAHLAVIPPYGREQPLLVAAARDGTVYFGVFLAGRAPELRTLGHFEGGVQDVAAFRHHDAGRVLVAGADSELSVINVHGLEAGTQRKLGRFHHLRSVSGWMSPLDRHDHAVVALADGELRDVTYGEGTHTAVRFLTRIAGATRVAARWADADRWAHVLVASNDGSLREVSYRTPGGLRLRYLKLAPAILAPRDVGPDLPDPTSQSRPSPSGLTLALAGDATRLYAVSLNAGVWRSVAGAPWVQLINSPARAYSIAVERNVSSHVVVGERNGDNADFNTNSSALWESFDGGDTWNHVLDPRSLGCQSQAIPALLFNERATLFVATELGVARRRASDNSFTLLSDTSGKGFVTALSLSAIGGGRRVWARTATSIMYSDTDGESWTTVQIPAIVDKFGTTGASPGDQQSLAGFGTSAVVLFMPDEATDPVLLNSTGNQNTMLYFDAAKDKWSAVVVPNTGNGTGLGGRRNVKSYVYEWIMYLPNLGPIVIPVTLLYFVAGQQIFSGQVNSGGTIDWTMIADTSWDKDLSKPMHADIWDVHRGGLFEAVWACGDGGVYRQNLTKNTWDMWNQGLHTHHIHTVEIIGGDFKNRPQIAYTTSDNDQWVRNGTPWSGPSAAWQGWAALGDSNWSKSDPRAPGIALIVRHREAALMTTFGASPPAGAGFVDHEGIVLDHYKRDKNDTLPTSYADGPSAFHVIQTRNGDQPQPLLDAIMLVDLPFTTWNGTDNVPVNPNVPTGQPSAGGNPVLVRNLQFGAGPNADTSQLANWSIEANDLPAGTIKFWVSGTHANPVYYLLVRDPNYGFVIYKRTAPGVAWQPLNNVKQQLPQLDILDGGSLGPVFLNPYDENHFYVLTDSGIQVSLDGGVSFKVDGALTDLCTDGKRYPFVGRYGGGNGQDVIIASRANPMGTLSAVAFNRFAPHTVVASSPFTGVFYRQDVGDPKSPWVDLGSQLPAPFTAVSSIMLDDEGIYVGTEGRGLLRITSPLTTVIWEPPIFRPADPLWDPLPDPVNPVVLGSVVQLLQAVGAVAPPLAVGRFPDGTERESDVMISDAGESGSQLKESD
jgi:hypothetical protein